MTRTVLIAALAILIPVSVGVHYLNDFARVQNAQVTSTPFERGTLSQVVVTNNASKKIAFQLRCNQSLGPNGGRFSRDVVLQPRASLDVDVNPELAGREVPARIANKSCEATWRGPLGISCRAWVVRWTYGKPAQKGIIMAEEDGACRIATCYSTSRLAKVPNCLSAVYLSGR